MKRTLAALVTAIVPCSCASVPQPAARAMLPSATTLSTESARVAALSAAAEVPPARDMRLRAPGDYVVYRFSGALRAHPLSLTERVIRQDRDVTTLEYTLVDRKSSQTLRVKMAGSSAEPKVVSVAKLDNGVEEAVPISAYDALLAKTMTAADRNDGLVSRDSVAVELGGKSIDCNRSTYRVAVGKRDATMTVLASEAFPWGDVGGELRASDGALLYKAEVVEAGHDASSTEVAARTK